mgnify:CR=1 FL=1
MVKQFRIDEIKIDPDPAGEKKIKVPGFELFLGLDSVKNVLVLTG